MKQLACKTLQAAINQYLSLDPNSIAKLKSLSGKTLKLNIKPIELFFCFKETQIEIKTKFESSKIDATLAGYPAAFIQLHFSSSENAPNLFKQELTISGDIEFGQNVRDLFQTIDIDWEEHLSQLTGDIVAHECANVFKRSVNFVNDVSKSMQQSLTEYLQEETKHLPTREEIEDFFDDVDNLKLRLDRLQAKLL